MATMGSYCKAYTANSFRAFGGWAEKVGKVERQEVDGKETDVTRDLTDDDILYLQENFVVTNDIFMDEGVVFDDVTPEWIDFCKNQLKFEVPTYELGNNAESTGADQQPGAA
jgi:hypothetical protein